MQLARTVLMRSGPVLVAFVLSLDIAAADPVCLTGEGANAPSINWNACTMDEKLSVALGMLLSDRFRDRYDPIAIDGELLKIGFENERRATVLPIDLQAARDILERIAPPTSPGERYAIQLSRMLGCRDSSRDVVLFRALEPASSEMETAGAHCLAPASDGTGTSDGASRIEEDAVIKVSYRREPINMSLFEALKKEAPGEGRSNRPLERARLGGSGELESDSFVVGQTIPGWQTVLQKMEPMVDYEVVIPPSQAYGERGVEGVVKPGEYLRFVMRLECDGPEDSVHPDCRSPLP